MLDRVFNKYCEASLPIVLIGLLSPAVCGAELNTNDKKNIVIPSAPLKDNIQRIAERFNTAYVVSPLLLKNKTSPSLSGTFTLEQALSHLLEKSNLTFTLSRGGIVIGVREKQTETKEIEEIEEIKVNGIRGSLNLSRQEKREESRVTDIIVAQDIARYPDRNLAESMQRIPGMSITREAGEGRQVVLRGLNPDYTLVTINGMPVLSNNDSPMDSRTQRDRDRSFDLNLFTSELFNQIKVHKSYSADMPTGGIAGIAALRTAKPFDTPGLQWSIAHQIDTNQYAKDPSNRTSFTLSSSEDNWGALVSLSYGNRNYQEQGANTFRWRKLLPLGLDTSLLDSEILNRWQDQTLRVPRGNRYSVWRGDMQRVGLGAALEYVDDNSHVTLDWIYGRLNSTRQENHLYPRGFQSTPAIAGETAVIDAQANDRDELVYAKYTNARVGTENRLQTVSTLFQQAVLNAQHTFSNYLSSESVLGIQHSTYTMPKSIRAYMRGQSDIAIDYRQDYYFPNITYSEDLTQPDMWQMNELDSENYASSSNFIYAKEILRFTNNDNRDWHIGADFVQFESKTEYTDIQDIFIDEWALRKEDVPLNSAYPFTHHQKLNWLALNPQKVFQFYTTPTSVEALLLSYPEDRAENNVVKEERFSVFFQQQLQGTNWSLHTGLRAEYDTATVSILQAPINATYSLNNLALLPAVTVNYRTNHNVVRLGISKTIGYPELDVLTRSIRYIEEESVLSVYNDTLKPITAYNFDVSIEAYPGDVARFSTNLFGKWIKNSIVARSQTHAVDTLATPFANLLPKAYAQPEINVVAPHNQQTFFLYGIEGSAQFEWPLDKLSSRFDIYHIGIVANASYTFGRRQYYNETTGARLEKKPLPYLSPVLANVTAYLEGYSFSFRLSATYRDSYIARVDEGTLVDEDETGFLPSLYLDGVIAYQMTDNVEIRMEATNLTNEREIQYSDSTQRPYNTTVSGRNYSLSLAYRF